MKDKNVESRDSRLVLWGRVLKIRPGLTISTFHVTSHFWIIAYKYSSFFPNLILKFCDTHKLRKSHPSFSFFKIENFPEKQTENFQFVTIYTHEWCLYLSPASRFCPLSSGFLKSLSFFSRPFFHFLLIKLYIFF